MISGQYSLRIALAVSAAISMLACGRADSPAFSQNETSTSKIMDESVPSHELQADLEGEITLELRRLLNSKRVTIGRKVMNPARLKAFYEARSEEPIFVSSKGLEPIALELQRALLEKPNAHGLTSSDYWFTETEARWNKLDTRSLAELELLLSAGYMQLITDLNTGKTNPQDSKQELPDIELKKRNFSDFKGLLAALSSARTLESSFDTYAPNHVAYRSLLKALARLRATQSRGGWSHISYTKTLRRGDSHNAIPGIRARLYDLGFMEASSQRNNNSPIFDEELLKATLKFQNSMKLGTDGVIGQGTFRELGRSLETRIGQVRANLERWRLMPRDLGDHYMLIDLNQQELMLSRAGRTVMNMKVIVGKNSRPTPTFVDRLTSVIVNPYWHAPISIVVKDILPKAAYDPSVFSQLNMRVLDKNNREIDPYNVDWARYSLKSPPPFMFRQEPGPRNSLGQLKFDLSDNRNSIYLHDTNHPELFRQQLRLFSSGCIRVEFPRELAAYLLGPQGHDVSSISTLINNSRLAQHRVRLNTFVRVYILGQSIAVDESGTLRFGRDFYDQDTRFVAALDGRPVPGSSARAPETPAPKPNNNRPSRPSPRPAPSQPWSPFPFWW